MDGQHLEWISGFRAGHFTDSRALTGCTVVIPRNEAVAAVSVRGGAPGTRETDLLQPGRLVERIHGVVLAGGSAFGLQAAGGVMRYLEERGRGYPVGPVRVPIVPAAILFDLGVGDSSVRPGAAMGYEAATGAREEIPERGNHGAGTGATVGKALGPGLAMKGGLGYSWVPLGGGAAVAALVAVNALGDVACPRTGRILAGCRDPQRGEFLETERVLLEGAGPDGPVLSSTTIGVIMTDAALSRSEAHFLAAAAHDGLARTIRPCHTQLDGDTLFLLSTGEREARLESVGAGAVRAVAEAVVDGIMSAQGAGGLPSAGDIE